MANSFLKNPFKAVVSLGSHTNFQNLIRETPWKIHLHFYFLKSDNTYTTVVIKVDRYIK